MYHSMGEVRNQYAVPKDYGIPNPLGPRTHNWKGGVLNEGSLYHGPVYTRPSYRLPWMMRPLRGVGQTQTTLADRLLVIAFSANAQQYPAQAAKLEALFEEAKVQGRGDAVGQKAADCVRRKLPEFSNAVDTGDLDPAELLLTEKEVSSVVSCLEGGLVKLGIILPLVAAGALVVWLFARK